MPSQVWWFGWRWQSHNYFKKEFFGRAVGQSPLKWKFQVQTFLPILVFILNDFHPWKASQGNGCVLQGTMNRVLWKRILFPEKYGCVLWVQMQSGSLRTWSWSPRNMVVFVVVKQLIFPKEMLFLEELFFPLGNTTISLRDSSTYLF